LPSGEKTTSAAGDHARAARNLQHIHQAGLADVVARDQHDREQVHAPRPPPKFLSKRQVLDRIPLTYPTIWQLMRRDRFPRSFLVAGRVVWLEHEIIDWMKRQPRQVLKGDA
jgi:predicted DNA-binding transcriptional regulator AlpA